MPESTQPVLLVQSQRAQAAQVLARAFQMDPIYTTLFADEAERERALLRLFDAVVGHSLFYGVVHATPGLEGVACWLSPGKTEITLWRTLRTGFGLMRAVVGFNPQARRRFLAAETHMDRVHSQQAPKPHWYLFALGVDPAFQGRGIGGRLMEPVLAQADQARLPCYLETETESNVAFYQGRGFKVVHEGIAPGLEIRIWAMLREPR